MKMLSRARLAIQYLAAKFSRRKFKQYLYSKETYQHLKAMSKRQLINIILQQQIDLKRMSGGFKRDRIRRKNAEKNNNNR